MPLDQSAEIGLEVREKVLGRNIYGRMTLVLWLAFVPSADAYRGAVLSSARDDKTPPMPRSSAGADVVGKRLPLQRLTWLNTDSTKAPSLQGKVTLVRWWTDSCPFCIRSLPVIQDLVDEFGDRGFQALGVYHAKPPRPVPRAAVLEWARRRGFRGPVATDPEWGTLRDFYLNAERRPATSVSFLLDAGGRVQYVDSGPEFRPTEDPQTPANQAYLKVRAAIQTLLKRQ